MEINRINSRFIGMDSLIEGKKEGNVTDSFTSLLNSKLDEVNQKQIESEGAIEGFINGEDIDIHEVMLASEEAKMSIELAVQIRNKIVEAYQEINRMQL